MFSQQIIQGIIDNLVLFATDLLLPLMLFSFVLALIVRGLIYYSISRHAWFAREFEMRVTDFLETEDYHKEISFFPTVKRILERTYYEIFEVRAIIKRRNPDYIMSLGDRVFLINQGVAWLVHDIQKQVRHFRHGKSENPPKILQMTKSIFQKNPAFNRILGLVPAAPVNNILNILPGVFVIAGIFGTFLGIMKALPELGGMDLANGEQSKMVMDQFLLKISFAMSTSLMGIMLSVFLNFYNTLLSPDRKFIEIVERFENTMDLLWNRSSNNLLPENISNFDQHRDPIDALAEDAIQREISKEKALSKSVSRMSEKVNRDKAS